MLRGKQLADGGAADSVSKQGSTPNKDAGAQRDPAPAAPNRWACPPEHSTRSTAAWKGTPQANASGIYGRGGATRLYNWIPQSAGFTSALAPFQLPTPIYVSNCA